MFDNIRWYCLKKLSLTLCWQECAVRPRAVASLDMPDTASNEPGSKVSDPQHSQRLLRVLRTFWQEQSFHDALLVVDGEELPVQKNILAAASPYIRSVSHSTYRTVCKHQLGTTRACPVLFSGSAITQMILALLPVRTKLNYNPPKEDGSTYRIELQGVSMAIMKQILDYIFSGEVSGDALKSRVTC